MTTKLLYPHLDGQLSDIQPVGGPNIHIDYDPYDRRAAMTDGAGSHSYAYDDLDRPLSVTTTYTGLPAQTLSYGYFPDGSRHTLTTPAGTFTASYDLAARMTQLVNPFAETSSWAYLNNGWLSKQALGNGAYTTYAQNARGFTTGLQSYTSGGSLLSQFTAMAYDPVGNRTSMTSSIPAQPSYGGVTSYQFDSKNQLTQEQSARLGGYTNPFGYDLAGNPSNFKGTGHNFNSDNQDTGLAYTASGNPTTWYGNPLTFDPANQLTAYGSILTAGYTGDGLRAWKQTSAGRTYFLYDGAQPVVELNSSGVVTATNTFGPNGLLSRHTSSGSVFYQFDPQGSVAQRLNMAQTVQSTDMYDAYGTGQSTASNTDPWGYGAQWGYFTDRETGLLLLTHRYYDPAQGRFLTRDPIGYAGGSNLYGYVGNSPVVSADPLGEGKMLPLPGVEGAQYRLDMGEAAGPDMHIIWPDETETLVNSQGKVVITQHGGHGTVAVPRDKKKRKAAEKVINKFRKKLGLPPCNEKELDAAEFESLLDATIFDDLTILPSSLLPPPGTSYVSPPHDRWAWLRETLRRAGDFLKGVGSQSPHVPPLPILRGPFRFPVRAPLEPIPLVP